MGRGIYVIKKTGKGLLDGIGGIGETAIQEATKRVEKGQDMNQEEYFITMLPEDEKLPAEITIEALKGYLDDAKTKNILNSVIRFAKETSDGTSKEELEELTTNLRINLLATKEMQEDSEAMKEFEEDMRTKNWNGIATFVCEDLMERIPGVTTAISTVGYASKSSNPDLDENLRKNAEESTGVKSQLLNAIANKIEDGQNMSDVEIILEYNKELIDSTLGNINPFIKRGVEEVTSKRVEQEYNEAKETSEKLESGETTIPKVVIKEINGALTNAIDLSVEDAIPEIKGFYTIGNTIGKLYPKQTKEVIDSANKVISEPLQNMQEKLDEEGSNYGKVTQVLGDVGQNLGNMGVSAAVGVAAGPEAGLATMAVSARGRSAAEAMEKGATLEEAVEIGNAKAAVEVGTEKLTGGLNVFGKGSLDDIASNLTKNIKNQVVKKLADKGLEVSGEVLEETISDIVDTAIDRNTVDPDAQYTLEDWNNTAVVTALSTLTMNALTNGAVKYRQRANTNIDNTIQGNTEDTGKTRSNNTENTTLNNETIFQQSAANEVMANDENVYQMSPMDGTVLKQGEYNPEVREFIYKFMEQQLDGYETFRKVYGDEFARKKLNENILDVYTDGKRAGFLGVYDPIVKKICIYNGDGKSETLLTANDILKDKKIAETVTHESIHAVLNHNAKERKKNGTNYNWSTGMQYSESKNTETGRGANEGLTEWLCSKLGYDVSNSGYKTELNYINQLEQAVGEENIVRLGKGNPQEMAKILQLSNEELPEFLGKIDQVNADGYRISKFENLCRALNIMQFKEAQTKEEVSWAENYLEKSDTYRGIEDDPDYIQYLNEKGLQNTDEAKNNYFNKKLNETVNSRVQNIADIDNEIFGRYFKREYEQVRRMGRIPDKLFEKYSRLSQSINVTADGFLGSPKMGNDIRTFNREFNLLKQRQFEQFLDEQAVKINNETFSMEDVNNGKKKVQDFFQGQDNKGAEYKEKYNEFLGEVLGQENKSQVIELIKQLEQTGKLDELPKYQIVTTETNPQNNGNSRENNTKQNVLLKNGKLVGEAMTMNEYSNVARTFEKFKQQIQAIDPNAKIEWSGKNLIVSSGNAMTIFRIENNEVVPAFATNSINLDKLNNKIKTNETERASERSQGSKTKQEAKQSFWKRLKQWVINRKNGTKALPEGNDEKNTEGEMKRKKERFLNGLVEEAKIDEMLEYSNSEQNKTIELQDTDREENDDEYDR